MKKFVEHFTLKHFLPFKIPVHEIGKNSVYKYSEKKRIC